MATPTLHCKIASSLSPSSGDAVVIGSYVEVSSTNLSVPNNDDEGGYNDSQSLASTAVPTIRLVMANGPEISKSYNIYPLLNIFLNRCMSKKILENISTVVSIIG